MSLRRRAQMDDPAVAELLVAARRPGTDQELAGLDEALGHFRLAAAAPAPSRRRRVRLAPKLIGVGAALAIVVGGTAAAAATDSLPSRLQQPAHDIFRAPAPKHRPASPSPAPTGSSQPSSSAPASGTSASTPGSTSASPSTSPPTSSAGSSGSSASSSPPSGTGSVAPTVTKPGNPSPPGRSGKVKQPKKALPTQANSHASKAPRDG